MFSDAVLYKKKAIQDTRISIPNALPYEFYNHL